MPGETAGQTDAAHAEIGLVAALGMELSPFWDRCERVRKYSGGAFTFRGGLCGEVRVAGVESGLGFANARRATQSLIEAHTPSYLISCGFSGGLRSEMEVGHIAVADSVCDTHGNELQIDLQMPADPSGGLFVGRHVVADQVVRTVAEKKALAERYGADAVDMESLAVAQVGREAGVPFLSIRGISDDLSADLPAELSKVLSSTGSRQWGAAAAAIWKRPGNAKDLWKLREQAMRAAESLAGFLESLVPQLIDSEP